MQPETIFTCPHCNEEIDHLKYSCSRSEFGTCQLVAIMNREGEHTVDTEDYDCDDSGDANDYTYDCPECEETIRPNRIIISTPAIPKKKQQEERIEIIGPKHVLKAENGNLENLPSIPCKKCRKVIIFSVEASRYSWRNMEEDKSISCPHCGTLNDPDKYFKEFKSRQESRRRKNKRLLTNPTP